MSNPPTPSGISNRAQAILVIIGSILMSVGSVQLVLGVVQNTTVGIYIGIAVILAGAVGLGIKEGVGALPQPPK